jgi:hypothetical protein
MAPDNANATRAGRTIDNLDDRGSPTANPGDKDKTGNEMPDFEDDILETEEKAALDHVQVSGIADVAESGEISRDESVKKP